jgi:hypothetical protein
MPPPRSSGIPPAEAHHDAAAYAACLPPASSGELQGAGERPVSAEQMELARVKTERDIPKGATAYSASESL